MTTNTTTITIDLGTDYESLAGEGWVRPAREVMLAFAAYLAAHLADVWPDAVVDVSIGGREIVATEPAEMEREVRWESELAWAKFVENAPAHLV